MLFTVCVRFTCKHAGVCKQMCVLDKLCLNITVCEVGRDGMFFLDCYFRSSVSDR